MINYYSAEIPEYMKQIALSPELCMGLVLGQFSTEFSICLLILALGLLWKCQSAHTSVNEWNGTKQW